LAWCGYALQQGGGDGRNAAQGGCHRLSGMRRVGAPLGQRFRIIPKPAVRCSIDPADKTGKSATNGEEMDRDGRCSVRVTAFLSASVRPLSFWYTKTHEHRMIMLEAWLE
jgi:hypothetical protein